MRSIASSDQGESVRFPVGAQFDDFRVIAVLPDGWDQEVTRKATIRFSQGPDASPASVRGGRLVGVRPGATQVHAEFAGLKTEEPLNVEVTAQVDLDQIDVDPTPVTLMPGETGRPRAYGYKSGNSIGVLTTTPKNQR